MAIDREKLLKKIASKFRFSLAELSPKVSFVEDLGADSLDMVELVMYFEDEFDISIPDEDFEKIKTVQDALDYLNERVQQTPQPCSDPLNSLE